MIKMGVIGSNYADICLFLARSFNALGKKTALIDNSYSKELSACIPGVELGIGKVDYRNVTFMQNKDWHTMETTYDVMICASGDNEDISFLEGTDYILLITDQNAYHYKLIENIVSAGIDVIRDINTSIILRDYIKCKITDRYIRSCLTEFIDISNTYTVGFNEKDKDVCFTAQYNNVFKFDLLSTEMKNLLVQILATVLGDTIDSKTLNKSFRLAERGM